MIRTIDTRALAARALTARLLITASLLLGAMTARAQNSYNDGRHELWAVGIFGGAHWFSYTADMNGLPGVPSCCPQYTDGSGNGFSFGVTGEHQIVSGLSGGLRLLYSTNSGSLTAEEQELVTAERDTVTATFGHTIAVEQPAIGAEAFLSYEAIRGLRLIGGVRADMMMGGTYHQKEEIITPDNIRFENGLRQRLVFDGDIPAETAAQFSLVAGVRYDVPINRDRTLLLSPEVMVWQGLNDLASGTTWKMRGVRAGISLWYIDYGTRAPSPLEPGQY